MSGAWTLAVGALLVGQAGAQAAENDPRLFAAYEKTVAFLAGQPSYTLDVRVDWKVEGGDAAGQSGVNAYRYQLQRPNRFRIEVRNGGGEAPNLVTVCDGKQATTYYPAKKLSMRAPLTDPKEGLDSNPILAMSLEGSLIDTFMQRNLVEIVKDHATNAKHLGTETIDGRTLDHYALDWGQTKEEMWFGPEAEPLPRKVVMIRRVPAPGGDDTRLTSTATLTWDVKGPIPAEAFTLALPEDAVEVEDIYTALSTGTTGRLVGQPAPAIDAKRDGGAAVRLADLKGKVVVVDFWAGWCAPCLTQLPAVAKLVKELEPKGVVLLAVNVGEKAEEVAAFAKEHPEAAGSVLDPESRIADAYGVTSIPALVVIGPDGTVKAVHSGEPEDLEATLRGELEGLVGAK